MRLKTLTNAMGNGMVTVSSRQLCWIYNKSKTICHIPVDLAILTIDKGKLVRTQITTYSIPPSLERMTEEEYNQEWKELLEDIPPEFHSFIQTDCYERGHSAGYEEVINYAHEMVYNIKGPIKNFEKRLIG